VEGRLVEQKERELKYCEKIRILEFHNESKENCIKILKKELELIKKEKEGVDGKLEGFLTASKDLDNLIKNYSRPSPAIKSTSDDAQNKNPSVTKTGASDSTILSKPFIKFMKAADCTKVKTNKVEAIKKSSVKYAEMYRRTTKKPNVIGNQRNWNNLKSHQLGPDFVMKKKACFNYGDFNHLAYDCRERVKKGASRSSNKTHESFKPRPVVHRPFRPPVRPMRPNMNFARPNKPAHSYGRRPFRETTQDLIIILIQRVQRLERELKSRTPIHKVDRGRSKPVMAWVPKKI
nr:hypothetical protein [Tanacetum cinerariifolium]